METLQELVLGAKMLGETFAHDDATGTFLSFNE
ncbi:hypothetical protein NC651_025858 [Populus alba x Populus x berolinensis]|nr:hypothetical protein NC651_025858 [Populus alba x Populus x berolinensis]